MPGGYQALHDATGSRNVALGPNAGINLTFGSRNVDIANPGVAGESGTIRIGTDANQDAAFLAGVWNTTAPGPTKPVVVNSKGGQLATATGPSPAAQPRGASEKLSRVRAENRRQSAKLRQQAGALRQMRASIKRLRQQMQNGG